MQNCPNNQHMKKILFFAVLALLFPLVSSAVLGVEQFSIRPVKDSEFYTFVKVFSEMRGPLRSEIMKDSKTNFESADPLKYVTKVKDDKDVVKILKDKSLSWDQFTELMGNILLGYFSIQPDKTKAALVRQLADYGLGISDAQIPAEYQQTIKEVLKTDEGAALAGMALEMIVQIPSENVTIAKKNKRTLDQLFYTRFWRDKI